MSSSNRIDQALERQPGLWPFLPAGYPSLDITSQLLRAYEDLDVRGVELGFPFSDPIADGPVIQHAFSEALAEGVRVADVLNVVDRLRGDVDYPILAMVSASIIYRFGTESFVKEAAEAGIDGLIVPDISLEEAPNLAQVVAAADLRLSMLVAPTTPPDRQQQIAQASSGFLYYVSVQGTTGARNSLPPELEQSVVQLKSNTNAPVLVGFGIGNREQVGHVCQFADGAIVGSALVRRMSALSEDGETDEAIVSKLTEFTRELSEG